LHALLVNPGVAVSTKLVFAGWKPSANSGRGAVADSDFGVVAKIQNERQLVDWLRRESNDLEAPSIALEPAIADVLASLRAAAGCRLARMSGSGATCFALFSSLQETAAAGQNLRVQCPDWWISETVLG
jgi:4-diphosphocytidyl-2-C-methyl-D-erythritol kinase